MEYARAKGVRLEVEAIGGDAPTRVGPVTRPPRPRVAAPRLRVVIAGFGAVGRALFARLQSEPRFEVTSILVKDAGKAREPHAPAALTASIERFLSAEADILVEATSDVGAARSLCRTFLSRGRPVVTASKKLVAGHLPEWLALTPGQDIRYSAAVGGGTPALETARLARAQGRIRGLRGLLNGTVNFVLGELASGATLEAAVASAMLAGFAEADPSEDLSGRDVEAKLRILAAHSFESFDRLDLRIEPLGEELVSRIRTTGERWVQLASLTRRGAAVIGGVRFTPARYARELPPLERERNFLSVCLEDGRNWVAAGRGAGGLPTAEAIMSDLYDLARSRRHIAAPAAERLRAST
jgi:homoserine dehydrogenase